MSSKQHNDLVSKAKYWLSSAKQCNPVFTEKGSSKTGEMPDTIGWTGDGSIVVECKTSIADFRNDKKKSFRKKPKKGMGKYRYLLFSQELYNKIPKDELPEGWGIIIEGINGHVRQVNLKSSDRFKYNIKAELYYLRNRILNIQNFGR